jgi:hypothetical protein
MNVKQTGMVLALLWLIGCAATDTTDKRNGSASTTDVVVQVDRKGVTDRSLATRPTKITETIDANPTVVTTTPDEKEILTLARLLERLDKVTSLEVGLAKQRFRQMDAMYDELKPADRYELALLLTYKSTNNKSLSRAISILDELKEHVKDRIVLQILLLHRRYFDIKKQYRSERSKTIELNKKIERLKGLEQDLDKSNTRMQESLNPKPGDAQQQ